MSTTINEPTVSETNAATPASRRLASIDILRGLMMIIMALDHTRDFFSNAQFDPLNLSQTTPALFFTRWITHFCAPIFVLLAGVSAYLYGAKGRRKIDVARFLLIRGLLLIVLEFTLVHLGWFFSFQTEFLLAQVIWALGWCMLALAGLIFLPRWLLLTLAIVMIAGHNLLDTLPATRFGSLDWLWIILHQGGTLTLSRGHDLFIRHPLIPWIGVMALGYALAPIFLLAPDVRRKRLLLLGISMIVAFIALRTINMYGDPVRWIARSTSMFTMLSFLNTNKYPPSLLFLLMTLGPAFVLLATFDSASGTGRFTSVFRAFGQVPLFYYVMHLALIHALAVIFSLIRYGKASWLFGAAALTKVGLPANYGYDLAVVYGVWVAVVIFLYPLCKWYARLKRLNPSGWLRYF